MPTVIILDTSLSMCRPVPMTDVAESYQFRNLAVHGLTSLLDYMNTNCKLEFAALMSFSSYRETIVPFTRDFDSMKGPLIQLEYNDRARVVKALDGVQSLIMEEWGAGVPCQVILITDGVLGLENETLKSDIDSVLKGNEGIFPLPFPFPSKLHVVCIADSADPYLQASLPTYQKLIDVNGGGGEVFIPEGQLTFKSIQAMFMKLANLYYKPFHGVLHCGHLTSSVSLSPPPEPFCKSYDFDVVKADMSTDIIICGFISILDVASPPSHSRHLVLPLQTYKVDEPKIPIVKLENSDSMDEESTNEDGKQPSFCVLLHGSLKVESMVALCHLGGDWYGMLYSWADSKKKSNLMLSTFEPGPHVIAWIGNFTLLGPPDPTATLNESDSPFPIKPTEKRSYAQNCVVWIKQSGLQADIQKILRHARKLPEKTQNFYKELNRLRKAALSFGFHELLDGMATILDRECTLLPGSAHPDAALQLTHCANALRNGSRDYNTPVLPLRTKFSMED